MRMVTLGDTGLTVSLQVPSAVKQIYAHELAHVALRQIMGEQRGSAEPEAPAASAGSHP